MLTERSRRGQDEHNDCEGTPCGSGAHMCFDLFNTWRCECTEGFQVSDNTCKTAAQIAAGLAEAAANALTESPAPAPVAAATPPP